jgi:hypothetical protein
MIGRRRYRRTRRGTTTVELAVILPVLLVFLYGLIEFGRAQWVSNMLNRACRAAARYGAGDGVTTAEVQAKLREILTATVDPDLVEFMVKDAGVYDEGGSLPETPDDFAGLADIEVADAEPRHLFLVRASLNYQDIALFRIPLMDFMGMDDVVLVGLAVTRHE